MCTPEAPDLRYDLQPRGTYLALERDGVRIALRKDGRRVRFVRYAELTQCDVSERGLWLATAGTIALVRRSRFSRPEGPQELAEAVWSRLSREPGGPQQLDRMLRVGERGRHPRPRLVTVSAAAICLVLFLLQLRLPLALEVGSFVPSLVREGELWRIVTGNFLHGISLLPLHLLVNMLCLLAFGVLVERPLGAIRTFLVLAAGAVGAMAGSYIAGYDEVIGASGMVAALAGAVLWLEFHEAERLPAWWRLPRRLFVTILVLQGLADLVLPFVAAGAHLGGFFAGYLATRFVSEGALDDRPSSRPLRWVASGLAFLAVVSFLQAGQLLLREGAALEHYARRLLLLEDIDPGPLNDLAWRIVTEFEYTDTQLELAKQLATEAVERSGRSDPDLLDTLAEVLFTAGDGPGAVEVIDEAIVLTGGESYFFEQRRRFTGERAAEDRPPPPALPWQIRKQVAERFFGAPSPGL